MLLYYITNKLGRETGMQVIEVKLLLLVLVVLRLLKIFLSVSIKMTSCMKCLRVIDLNDPVIKEFKLDFNITK